MARVLTKKSTVAAKVPLPADLEIGELAVNTADAKLYTKHSDGTVKQVGGGGGIASPTISRILTSTNPDEPTQEGDMLIVLPRPKVIAAAFSQQTYGAGDSVNSASVVVPIEAEAGDSLFLLVGSSHTLQTVSGFSSVRTQDSPRVLSQNGMGRSTVLRKIATGAEAGATITVSQTSAGRLAFVLFIVRGGNGSASIEVVASASSTTIVGSGHNIPSLGPAAQMGTLALLSGCCVYINSAGENTIGYPAGWIPITPTSDVGLATNAKLRHWAAYKKLSKGEAVSGACTHFSPSVHEGSCIAVTVRAI